MKAIISKESEQIVKGGKVVVRSVLVIPDKKSKKLKRRIDNIAKLLKIRKNQ